MSIMGRVFGQEFTDSGLYYPQSFLDPSTLLTSCGKSIIVLLLDISNAILINDSDPSVEDLVEHLRRHVGPGAVAYDLSRSLRLSVNHVYWISKVPGNCPIPSAEQIWPK
jgi:hypothetical protein